jgi:hypothetical protein
MAQISRPLQIALAVLVVAGAGWFLALRPHHSSAPTEQAINPVPAPATHHPASASVTKTTHVTVTPAHASTHPPASTAAAHKPAHTRTGGTVAPTHTAATHTTTTHTTTTHVAAGAAAGSTAKTHASTSTPGTATKPVAPTGPIRAKAGVGRVPAQQALVERALGEGKVAVILFWNRKGSDDRADRYSLALLEAVHHLVRPYAATPAMRRLMQASGMQLGLPFAAFFASASEVTDFGTITRGVQVYGTPTLIVVGKAGQAHVITGFTDPYSIQQAIEEARGV